MSDDESKGATEEAADAGGELSAEELSFFFGSTTPGEHAVPETNEAPLAEWREISLLTRVAVVPTGKFGSKVKVHIQSASSPEGKTQVRAEAGGR